MLILVKLWSRRLILHLRQGLVYSSVLSHPLYAAALSDSGKKRLVSVGFFFLNLNKEHLQVSGNINMDRQLGCCTH